MEKTSSSSREKGLKRKGATKEPQEAAVIDDGQQEKGRLAAERKLKGEREALSDTAPPKSIPMTMDNQRAYDETTVDLAMRRWLLMKLQMDLLLPSTDKLLPRSSLQHQSDLMGEPYNPVNSSHVYYRRGLALKMMIPPCSSRDFTDLIVIHEDCKAPHGLILSHLPNGSTAHF
ncbi:Ribosome production factor 1 [Myotis davidii]|uniref:Ribosome production factor 1 n=1 Tax=Myotis davidii TaxID=225400 RepID=L5LIW6_MYODS|nr:Ribosome production factor 1 [Myotis davidii]